MISTVPHYFAQVGLVLTASMAAFGQNVGGDPCSVLLECKDCVTTITTDQWNINGTCVWEITTNGAICKPAYIPDEDVLALVYALSGCDADSRTNTRAHRTTTVAPTTSAPPSPFPTIPLPTNGTTTGPPTSTTTGPPTSTTTGPPTSTTTGPPTSTTTGPPTSSTTGPPMPTPTELPQPNGTTIVPTTPTPTTTGPPTSTTTGPPTPSPTEPLPTNGTTTTPTLAPTNGSSTTTTPVPATAPESKGNWWMRLYFSFSGAFANAN